MLPTCQSPGVQKPGWASPSFGQGRLFILFSGQWVEWFLTGQHDKKREAEYPALSRMLTSPAANKAQGTGRREGRKNVRTIGWRPVQGSAALWTQHSYCMNKLTALCACVQYQPDSTPRMDGEMTSRPHSILGSCWQSIDSGAGNPLPWGCGHGRIPPFQWTAPHPCPCGKH